MEGPKLISNIDETGVMVKFQSQTSKVARFCLQPKVEAEDAEDAESDPMRERLRSVGPVFESRRGPRDVDAGMDLDWEGGNPTSGAGIPGQ